MSKNVAARKILMISINTTWNIVNFRSGLIRELINTGYDVVAVAPHDTYSKKLKDMGCRHIELSIDNKGTSPLKDLGLFIAFRSLMSKERPDAFLGYTIKPNVYGTLAARSLGIPTINNISGLGTAFIRESWLTAVVRGLYRTALAGAYCVFFQNDDDRSLFTDQKLVRAESARLLPGSGIDLNRFRPVGKSDAKGQFRFLLIARLLRDKGVLEFVEAARLIRKAHPTISFQLLGFLDVENRTAISSAMVDQWIGEGVIEYLGVTEDVRPHIAAADCIVLPSYREGTPRTLLEAAAMGKPLIATDVPGCREVVVHGENGYLCEVKNAEDLARKCEDLIRLPDEERRRMGDASRQKMEREFDEKLVISAYMEVLEELFKRPAPP
jgi:glycosyltransferase involved in cell wall biosynthesis